MKCYDRRKLDSLCFLLFVSASFSRNVRADNTTEMIKLDEKQSVLQEKNNRTQILAQKHAEYMAIRDSLYYGDQGVIKKINLWNDKIITWLGRWQKMLGTMQQINNLSSLTTQDQIKTELNALGKDYIEIQQLAKEFQNISAIALKRLNALEDTPPTWLAGYENQITAFNTQIIKLQNSFSKVQLSKENHDKWQQLLQITQETILLTLKKDMLQYPELQAAIAQVDELFAAEHLVAPYENEAYKRYSELNEFFNSKRIFALDAGIQNFALFLSDAKNRIKASGIDASFTNQTIKQLDQWMSLITSKRKSMDSLPKYVFVLDNFKKQGRILAADCKNEQLRRQRNCELYKQVFSIPMDKFSKLNEIDLKTIEFQIEEIKKNPLLGVK